MNYLIHFLIGLGGMGAGYLARNYCPHLRHQIAVGGALLALESYSTVSVVG